MTEERCELWELPVSSCGCPVHRGGKTPEEEARSEGPGPWFRARYTGRCVRGQHDVEPGTPLRAIGEGGYECNGCVYGWTT